MNSQAVKITVAVIALGVAGILFTRNSDSGDSTEGVNSQTHWLCQNSKCEADFSMSARDMLDFTKNAGLEEGGPPCPSCGKTTTSLASICPSCQDPYELGAHGMVPDDCPNCGEPLL